MKYRVIILSVFLLMSCASIDETVVFPEGATYRAMTFEDFAHTRMTEIVGEKLQLTAPLSWEDGDLILGRDDGKIHAMDLEIPIPDSLVAMDQRFRGLQNAHIRVEGEWLSTDWKGGREHHVYRGKQLQRGHPYVLFGHFTYRKQYREETLANEAIINQHNNPAYWSQTFKFVVDHLAKL